MSDRESAISALVRALRAAEREDYSTAWYAVQHAEHHIEVELYALRSQVADLTNDDPDCKCEHPRLRHAADMGFCYDCQCKLHRPEKA